MCVWEIVHYNEINSTSAELKRLAKEGLAKPGLVLVADVQKSGHGQYERVFESPEGGLYMSVYIKKDLPFNPDGLTHRIGVIMQDVLRSTCSLETDIKEPNDILYKNRKLCGILVESFSFKDSLHIVIGIGLNLNTDINDFTDNIKAEADSVAHIIGHKTDKNLVINNILNKLKEV